VLLINLSWQLNLILNTTECPPSPKKCANVIRGVITANPPTDGFSLSTIKVWAFSSQIDLSKHRLTYNYLTIIKFAQNVKDNIHRSRL
jgi:hypothetical protein